jgi:hypothetical protein
MPAHPAFIGGSYVSQSPIADMEQTINFYVERIEAEGAKDRYALYPTPGVDTLTTAAGAPGRGILTCEDRTFCVIGATFYELTSADTLTSRGTVVVNSNPATLSWNGDGGGQVFVTSGNNGYIFDLTSNTFTLVRTGATTMGAHIDGYFLALDTDTSTLYLSDLLDGTTWDPTQFAQRSIQPDPWVSMKVLDRYIWLMGTDTSEVWYNAGAFPFPFVPHPSGLVQYGCGAPFSPKVVGGSLMWLARTAEGIGHVVQTSGFSPQVVSTFALHAAIDTFTETADAIGDSYEHLGHAFYVLTFPIAKRTVAYDATPNMDLPAPARWTDRGTWISESNVYDAWRPLYHTYAFGKHIMLDRESGDVYHLSHRFGVDADGRPIRRMRRAPGLWRDNQRITYPAFELHLEAGLGLSTGQGSNPLVAMRISNDGGKTFGNERQRSAGARGKYQARLVWQRCGQARHRVFEIVMSDPVPWRITGASLPDLRLEHGAA